MQPRDSFLPIESGSIVRWVDIGDSYGIHGTIEPDSIGKNESRGCIRMLNSEVEEVYDFLVIGSEVKVQK